MVDEHIAKDDPLQQVEYPPPPASPEARDTTDEERGNQERDEESGALPQSRPGAFFIPGTVPQNAGPATPASIREDTSTVVATPIDNPIGREEREAIWRQAEQEERDRMISNAVPAEDMPEEEPKPTWKQPMFFVIALLIVAALTVGIAVPLASRDSTGKEDENVIASVHHYSKSSFSQNMNHYEAKLIRVTEETYFAQGAIGTTVCKPRPCLENPGACKVGNDVYEPGCCLGEGCPEDTKCGEQCLSKCHLVNPDDEENCVNSDCLVCDKVDGEDIYVLNDNLWQVDCIAAGHAFTNEGKEYSWMITCGPMLYGGDKRTNRDVGEYSCLAFRSGGGFKKTVSANVPCQFIQLGECGCAPPDVYPFGLPPPEAPCLPPPDGDCPFLCNDAGTPHARNLCHAFGGIKWWEGENFMGADAFSLEWDIDLFLSDELCSDSCGSS